MKQVSAPYISVRTWPASLTKEDQVLFSHEKQRQIDAVYSVEIPDLLFKGTGLFQVSRAKILPQLFWKDNQIQVLSFLKYWQYRIVQKLKGSVLKIEEPVLFVTDLWSGGYFHWIAEVLPKLVVANENGWKMKVLLDTRFKAMTYVEPSLRQIGFEPLFTSGEKLYCLARLQFISHFATTGNFHDGWLQKTRSMLRDTSKTPGKKIYITRKAAAKRKVSNEESILPLLNAQGFCVVKTDSMTFEEQRSLFSGCSVLVSIHGAGLSNMLFMPEGGEVLELRMAGDAINNCYFSMASALGLRYHYLQCRRLCASESQHTADLRVDVGALQAVLNNISQCH